MNKSTGKLLKMGDKINPDDQLKFLSSDAAAILMSSKRGRFVVKPTVTKGDENELLVYVKNVILPVKSVGTLSTRGDDETDSGIIDLKNYFGSDKFVVIGDKLSIKVNTDIYPINNNKFFIYRYEYGGKAISKKIPAEGNTIIFDKNILYQSANGSIPSESIENVDIYLFDQNTKVSSLITKINPLYLPENVIKEELKVQYDIFTSQNLTKDEILKELTAYINDIYGKTDTQALATIIKSFESK
jgi:hypothetical protein